MLICPITDFGDVNFAHLLKVVCARFLYYKVTKYLSERATLKLCKHSVTPQNVNH